MMELQLILETNIRTEVIYATCLISAKKIQKSIVLWVRFHEISYPPQNQHRFIARVWAREIVGTANELQVVLQMATPHKKLLFLAIVMAYFLSESSKVFSIHFFIARKFVIMITWWSMFLILPVRDAMSWVLRMIDLPL